MQSKIRWEQNGRKAILFTFATGQELKTHTALHNVLLIMLAGSCSFKLGGHSPKIITAGQVICIPATVSHSLQAYSNFKMILLK